MRGGERTDQDLIGDGILFKEDGRIFHLEFFNRREELIGVILGGRDNAS